MNAQPDHAPRFPCLSSIYSSRLERVAASSSRRRRLRHSSAPSAMQVRAFPHTSPHSLSRTPCHIDLCCFLLHLCSLHCLYTVSSILFDSTPAQDLQAAHCQHLDPILSSCILAAEHPHLLATDQPLFSAEAAGTMTRCAVLSTCLMVEPLLQLISPCSHALCNIPLHLLSLGSACPWLLQAPSRPLPRSSSQHLLLAHSPVQTTVFTPHSSAAPLGTAAQGLLTRQHSAGTELCRAVAGSIYSDCYTACKVAQGAEEQCRTSYTAVTLHLLSLGLRPVHCP